MRTGSLIFYNELVLGGLGLTCYFVSVWFHWSWMKVSVFKPSSESTLLSWKSYFPPCEEQRELTGQAEAYVYTCILQNPFWGLVKL